MSLFTSAFWEWYVGIITIVSIFACFGIIWWLSGGEGPKKGEEAKPVGHIWDENLQELNNPLPSWWKNMFYITLVFSIIYLILYPGLGFYDGLKGWTEVGQYEEEVKAADEKFGPLYAGFAKQSIKALGSDKKAMKVGERLYLTYCTACHGSDAGGVPGFPNLRDNAWLWGGEPEQIKATILNGRTGVMPAWEAPLGGAQGVHEVAQYVLSLSERPGLNAAAVEAGKQKFMTFCAGCHMPTGTGNTALGAPNLTDNIWLYGGHAKTIEETIAKGRNGIMPPHKEFLGEEKVHVLSAYIYNLSQ
ncbi:MAG: cytochrome-c oxidase, cbb3-type subunit III [Gammaproteobacteria bacterium]|nr:MAG: cytochrome-c oxidase, cbb3-type subunit III [Gammaproteobacteria bacterium]